MIDWKATVAANLFTDLRQTLSFESRGVVELNPIWKPVYRDEVFPFLFTAASAGLWHGIERQKNAQELYALWAIAQMFVVSNNRKLTGYGVPVLSWRF